MVVFELQPRLVADVFFDVFRLPQTAQLGGVDGDLEIRARPLGQVGGEEIVDDVLLHRVADRLIDHLPDDGVDPPPSSTCWRMP